MLTHKQVLYIDYMLQNPNALDADAHRDLKIAKKTIAAWHKQEEFQAAYEKALKKQWASYAKEAQKVMHELLYTGRADVALNAAKYILSSNGYDAKQEVDVTANGIKIEIDYGNS